MQTQPTLTIAQAETLQQKWNACQAAYQGSLADPHAVPRAESRLFDACLDLGMDYETACPSEWAIEQIETAMARL